MLDGGLSTRPASRTIRGQIDYCDGITNSLSDSESECRRQ